MIISPILPQIGEQLSIEREFLGTLVSAYALMVGVFAIISGPISDKIGRRRILLIGTGVMTVALVSHYFVVDYVSFLAVRVFAGMAGGVLSGAAVSYVGDYFPYERRGWATGWIMSGSAFGQIFGIPMGIVLAERLGFRAPFGIFAVTMALAFLLILARVPQPPVQRSTARLTIGKAFRRYMDMLALPEIRNAAIAFFLMFMGVGLYVVYLPTWLEDTFAAGGDAIATLFLIGGIANVLTGPQAGKLSDRIGRKGIILMACVGLCIVMLLTTVVVTEFWVAYPVFFMVMVLVAMRIRPFSALLTALVEGKRRGSLMSLAVALGQVGFAVGSGVSGPLYDNVGFWSNTVLGAFSVLGMGLMVWFLIPEPKGDRDAPRVTAVDDTGDGTPAAITEG